jgi:hypothetical protein
MIAGMRKSLLVVFSAAFAALAPPRAHAQQLSFLRITNPQEDTRYAAGATASVTGVIQLADSRKESEGLALHVRLYRKDFVIAQETFGKLKKHASDKNMQVFEASVTLPSEAGAYLLRVYCLDITAQKRENVDVASHSIFIQIVAAPRKQ